MREAKYQLVLFLSGCLLGFGTEAAHAASTPEQTQCLNSAHVDLQHACACDHIKQKYTFDSAPFSLERSDLKQAYKSIATVKTEAAVEARLKEVYEKERTTLSCHDKTVAEVKPFAVSESYTSNTQYASIDRTQYENGQASPELLAAEKRMNETIKKYYGGEQGIQNLTQCEDQINIQSLEKVAVIQPYCKIDLEAILLDNVYEFDSKLRNSMIDAIKNDPCFKRTDPIARVEIVSSSSLLANTGAALKLTFLKLSRLRAEAIAEIITNEFSVPRDILKLNFAGKNKGEAYAGTSGPCPYTYDAKKDHWEVLPEYRSGQKNLNEYKKVSLNIYFNENRMDTGKNEAHRGIFKKCTQVKFKCST